MRGPQPSPRAPGVFPGVLSLPLRSPQIQVFHLGEGMDSKNWMSRNKGDTGTMYLKHIKEVLGFITTQYWGLRVLMWDDMLRKISVGALQGERMGAAAVAPELGVSAVPIRMAALAGIMPGAQQEPMPGPVGTWVSGEHEDPQASSCRWHRRPCPHPCSPNRVRDSKACLTHGVVLRTRL